MGTDLLLASQLVGNRSLILCGTNWSAYCLHNYLLWLTGIKSLVAILLALVESVVPLLFLDLRLGDVLLVSSLIHLGIAHVGLSAHVGEDIVC